MADVLTPASLTRQAIDAALSCDWQKALDCNLELFEKDPTDVDCLNRIAKASIELGNYSKAKKICQDVLILDPYNTIAQKNLKRASSFKKNGEATNGHKPGYSLSPSSFLEEPGLTKVVTLIKVAEPQKLLKLSAGMMVQMVNKNRGIVISDSENLYIGALPDDISHHLQRLLKGGNQYHTFIKSIKSNTVIVIIREVHRSKKFRNQASFLDDARVISYSSDHLNILNEDLEADALNRVDETEEVV